MKRSYIYCNAFWFLFSLIFCIESYRLRIGSITDPGPGFFPFYVCFAIGGVSLIGIIQWIRRHEKDEKSDRREPVRWWNIVVILAAIPLYALSLETVGFFICTFLFVGVLLKVVEPQPWKVTILGGLIAAISADLVFNVVLRSQIPSGFFGF